MKSKILENIPIGTHKAYIKNIRIISRMENEEKMLRIETTYHVEDLGDISHYSPPIKTMFRSRIERDLK